jgi:hypothetical protein
MKTLISILTVLSLLSFGSYSLAEELDIVDAIQTKKIEVQAEGSGIDTVSVRIRKKVTSPLTIRIPVGTFFVSGNDSAQNMVSTSESSVELSSKDWVSVSADAACANRPKDIPVEGDKFSVQKSPQQAELAKLMPVLNNAGVDTETKQAAVWIVTDDADYEDLGTLVESPTGYGGTRAINEKEAANAMRICEKAGIDITKKAIWNDRKEILKDLKDNDLKIWLKNKK